MKPGGNAAPILLYSASPWLPGPHLQTLWSSLAAPRPRPAYRRERWTTPDGDFIDLDHLAFESEGSAPLWVIFHGLEGDSSSHYARAMMDQAHALGWHGVVVHFRGCSGSLNLAPRAYHSGDSAEIDWVMRRLHAQHPTRAMVACGVSLGGNALLKWLGEQGEAAGWVTAAAAICPPQDLQAGAESLSRGFNLVYTAHFLRTLRRKSLMMLALHPGLIDEARVRAARTFFDFDDAVTAPLHGFSSCFDYWTRSSCRQFLPGIRVPALVINALNDPFVPVRALAQSSEVSRFVELDYPAEGGHVGFPAHRLPGRFEWIPQRVSQFLTQHLPRPDRHASARRQGSALATGNHGASA